MANPGNGPVCLSGILTASQIPFSGETPAPLGSGCVSGPFLDGKTRKNNIVQNFGNAAYSIVSDGMERDQLQRLVKNFHGSVWPWVKSRPANHWIWRFAMSLSDEHLQALPQIINEMAGWRGFPSRGILKFAELREELAEHWELYRGKSVVEIVKALETKAGLRVTPKHIYELVEKFGLKRENNKGLAKRWNGENPERFWAHRTRASHVHKGFDMSKISVDYLEGLAKAIRVCRYCGTDIDYIPRRGHRPNGPALDRIDNKTGALLPEDVQIICHRCSTRKGKKTDREFLAYLGTREKPGEVESGEGSV